MSGCERSFPLINDPEATETLKIFGHSAPHLHSRLTRLRTLALSRHMGVGGKAQLIPQKTRGFRKNILGSHSLTLRSHLVPLNLSVSVLKTGHFEGLSGSLYEKQCGHSNAVQNCKAALSFSSLQGSDSLILL